MAFCVGVGACGACVFACLRAFLSRECARTCTFTTHCRLPSPVPPYHDVLEPPPPVGGEEELRAVVPPEVGLAVPLAREDEPVVVQVGVADSPEPAGRTRVLVRRSA